MVTSSSDSAVVKIALRTEPLLYLMVCAEAPLSIIQVTHSPDLLGRDVAHPHRPEERQQVVADMAGVVRADTGFQQVMRQPLLQDVGLEGLSAPAGAASLAGPYLGLFILPGLGRGLPV